MGSQNGDGKFTLFVGENQIRDDATEWRKTVSAHMGILFVDFTLGRLAGADFVKKRQILCKGSPV